MPEASDLIRIAFASGNAELNRELIERVAAMRPEVPLVVVAEFAPPRGEWVQWHVKRAYADNVAALRAAIGNRRIESAAMVFAPGVPLAGMGRAARAIARGRLTTYDEKLRAVSGIGWGAHLLRRAAAKAQSARTKKWLHRVVHPSEAEIPVRARLEQIYGIVRGPRRGVRQESPMEGAATGEGVSVVIPSRNGRGLLATLLPGLADHGLKSVPRGEIIVSDNGSDDGTAEWLAAAYPRIVVIRSAEPLSFARAVNAGIRAARFTKTLLLNNDMVVEPGFVAALDAAFTLVPNLFCATAQIFFPPGVRREETGKAVWRPHPRDFPVRCDEPVDGEDLTWVLYGSGGCSMFDTAKLRALGGVSEVFEPAYVEDLDLGYRAWKRGWPSAFCAGAKVEHRHRATTSRYYTEQELNQVLERNYLKFLIHAVGSPALFRKLWLEAIRRLQLNESVHTLRAVPRIGGRPEEASGALSEPEILALGAGDVAVFPGRAQGSGKPVVIVSPYLPFPLAHGGAVRMYNLMRRGDGNQVLMAFAGELEKPPDELLDICREVILVRRVGSHYRHDTALPDVVEEFASEAFRACLKQTIQRWSPGVVQLEFTQTAQYADACGDAKTILVEHDITFDLQQQLLATNADTGAARLELEQQLAKWKAFETGAWRQVDCVVTMSQKDAGMATGARRVECLPNGVDIDRFAPSGSEPEARRLLFIGSFAHLPNLLALEYFLKEVWPRLEPGFALHVIAGARAEYFVDFYKNRVRVDLKAPGVETEGFVSDVRDAYRRAELVLAPLTASAGTNIKVLEAMAMGRVVVSTPAGVNGLDVAPGDDCMVTDSAEAMAAAIIGLSANVETRKAVEAQARATALRYDWNEIAQAQARLYAELRSGAMLQVRTE